VRLALLHARALTVELARYPAYLVPTLLFPAAFFLCFAVRGPREQAAVRMAAFAGFASIGVAFFQFGVGISAERASPWETYLRTLPLGAATRLGARVLSAAPYAAAAAAVLILTAIATTDVSLAAAQWLTLALALTAGTAPFALLGIALGYWSPERGALPIANLLYLGLSYAGGLWMSSRSLPTAVAVLSPYLPTGALAGVLAAPVAAEPFPLEAWAELAGFALLFACLAIWGYRRDEGRRFR
jgi:ABC-2 type transport system permease protein